MTSLDAVKNMSEHFRFAMRFFHYLSPISVQVGLNSPCCLKRRSSNFNGPIGLPFFDGIN
jgi:hypothetical protein